MAFAEQKYTRGVGVYPGNPAEDYAPGMVPDQTNYRNLALLRPAYHSSSYDYNLTAQLLTDGIKESRHPAVMIHLNAVRGRSGDRILPALYSDNYVSLMPGERKQIRIQIEDADTRGESPRVVVEGFNVAR